MTRPIRKPFDNIRFGSTHIVAEGKKSPRRKKLNLQEYEQAHSPVRRAQDLIEALLRNDSSLADDDRAFIKEFARGGFRVGNLTDTSRDDLDWHNRTIVFDVRHNFWQYRLQGKDILPAQTAVADDFQISLSKVKRMLKSNRSNSEKIPSF